MAPVLAIDLDEVLGSFVPCLCNFHNEKYGTSFTLSDFHSYRFCEVWGGDDAEATRKVHEFFGTSHFLDMPVIPGAVDAMRKLRTLGYDLVVVTSRQLVIEPQTRAWLAKRFPPNTFSSVAFGNHWGLSGRKIRKVELCRQLGAAMLIDDSLGYVREMAEEGMRAVLFDLGGNYGWSKDKGELPEGVVCLKSWGDVVEYVRRGK